MNHALFSRTIDFTYAFVALASGAQVWELMWRSAEVKYAIYGGDLGDVYAPTSNDVRVAVYVRGRAAKEMFEAMVPDRKSECGIEKGSGGCEGNVVRSYRPSDGYQCEFGLDLRSGKHWRFSLLVPPDRFAIG